jgi:hypothetical protein
MSAPTPVKNYIFTEHALAEMGRRGISKDEVETVLVRPEQGEAVRQGRAVYQSKLRLGDPPKEYLLRVFVDIDRSPPEIVTAYRTSKIEKYWR